MSEEISQILYKLGSIEAKLDNVIHQSSDVANRVSSLERSRAWGKGILSVLALGWTLFVAWFEMRLKN